MAYCNIRHVYCEGAAELFLFDEHGNQHQFTMCYTQHEGKPCPYDKVDQIINEDIEIINRLIDKLTDKKD